MTLTPLTQNIHPDRGPTGIVEYEGNGGYLAVRDLSLIHI